MSTRSEVDRYRGCLEVKNLFMAGLTELVASEISWKLARVNDQLDVEVDWHGDNSYRVGIRLGHKLIATARYQPEGNVEIGSLLSQNLLIVCAVHQAEIEKWCPGAIAGIEATRNAELNTNCPPAILLVVKFKNGHFIEVSERDADTEEFKAHCLMIYDLPPL